MRIRLLIVLTLAIIMAGCAAATSTQGPSGAAGRGAGKGEFLAGAASRVITPKLDDPSHIIYMGGLERGLRPTGVHDDLHARALVMTAADGTSMGLVVLDLIGLFLDDVDAIRAELRQRHPEVELSYLAVASTHTHAGPDVIGLWTPLGGVVDDAYVATLRAAAAEAVAAAWAARRPARLYTGSGMAPGLARDTRLPEVIDDTVMALGLRDARTDEGIAALANWNSHPSVAGGENSRISTDFCGPLVRRLEESWGGVGLYASGALGGQIGSGRVKIPDPATGRTPDDRMRKAELIGTQVAGIALEALASARAGGIGERVDSISIRTKSFHVPMENARFAQGLAMGLIRPRRLYAADGSGTGEFPSELADRTSLRSGSHTLRTEAAIVDAGALRFAMIPGELYPELSIGGIPDPQDPAADFPGAQREPALRPLSGKPLFLIGLANDELGYLIPKSQWDSQPPYAYDRDEPQYGERNSVGPEAAARVMEALAGLM